jgi:hypothetical protein
VRQLLTDATGVPQETIFPALSAPSTSARWTSRMNFGGPYRTPRLAIITALVAVLAGAPVSAFDLRSDKNLAGVKATNEDDWAKGFEAELAPLASDMWGTQKRLEEKGFRVDRGNKSATGWWLTANNRNTSRSIKVQSDGAQLVVTAER